MQKFTFILISLLNFEVSCSGQDAPLTVSPNPVFSEMDTFQTAYGNKVISKYDYFLIRGENNGQKILRPFLDSISSIIFKRNSSEYDDYLLSFYKEDSVLNERSINEEAPEYRYKIFIKYNHDNFIACYNYRNSKFFYIDWGPKFND